MAEMVHPESGRSDYRRRKSDGMGYPGTEVSQMNNLQQGRTKSPCHGCEQRSAECHGICEEYLEFVEVHDKERSEINYQKHLDNLGYGAPYRTNKQLRNLQSNLRRNKV